MKQIASMIFVQAMKSICTMKYVRCAKEIRPMRAVEPIPPSVNNK